MKIIHSIMLTIILAATSLMLISCGPPRLVSGLTENDQAEIKIAESADTVSRSLVELARIQAVATPAVRDNLPEPESYGMKEVASLDWSGPVGPAIKQIAAASDYSFRVLGKEPAIPIVVTVVAKNVPLGTLLRDLAFQAGGKAIVNVYARKRVIELRYIHA